MTPRKGIAGRVSALVHRALCGIAWFSVFHPKSVLAMCAVVTAVAVYLASGLELSTDVKDLLPRDHPTAKKLDELFDRYGGTEPIVIAVSGRGSADVEDRIDLALSLRDRLADDPRLKFMSGLFGDDLESLIGSPETEALLAFLTPEEIEALAAGLTTEAIDQRVADNYARLRSPLGPLTSRLIAEDPLGLAAVAMRKVADAWGRIELVTRDGVLMTADDEYVVLPVRFGGQSHDYVAVRELIDSISSMALEEMDVLGLEGTSGAGPAPEGAEPGAIHVGMTGSPVIVTDYRDILGSDVKRISGLALGAVLCLFLLAFRRFSGLMIAAVPLIVGIVWTLGFGRLVIGEISVFTAGSVAILSGLAIDFTIHLYNRYLEEVHAGHDMRVAFLAAHGETGLGIVAAAITTSWAFLAAGFSSFRGLRHLGILCAAGVVLSLIASLLLVPAITAIVARLRPTIDKPRGLAAFGLGPILQVVVRRPRLVVVVGLAGMALLLWPAIETHLEEDLRRFRPTSAPSIILEEDLSSRAGASLRTVLALVEAETEVELLEKSAAIERAWEPLVEAEDGVLAAVVGPTRLVPPESSQRAALARLAELRDSGAVEPRRVRDDLLASLARHGFRVDDDARRVADRIELMLSREEPLTLETLREGRFGPMISDLLLDDRGAGGPPQAVVAAYPRRDAKTSLLVDEIRARLEASGVEADLLGGKILSDEIKPLIVRDGIMAMILSSAGVVLILFAAFRRAVLVALTFLPLVAGVAGAVGVMSLLGVEFNLVSLSILPLVLGIGIDNGIHVVHRFLTHGDEDLVDVFQHTGRGIVMTSLTTIVGFGALVFADYPGLVSSGVVAILGIGGTLVTAVTLLPALLQIVRVRDTKRGAGLAAAR